MEFSFLKSIDKNATHTVGFGMEIPLPEEHSDLYNIENEEEPMPCNFLYLTPVWNIIKRNHQCTIA